MTDNEKQPPTPEKTDSDLSIGERIQKSRKALELSAEELVLLLASYDFEAVNENDKGISLPTIYRYEKGEREPGAREIRLLCNALNVSADWLIFGQPWNTDQAADSQLANDFRSLVKRAADDKTLNALFDKNKARDNWHQLKLSEIKTRTK